MVQILVLAFAGLCISVYTYFVEQKVKANPKYKPVCDINDRISCTKPMQSPYGYIFYVSNALVGMGYYALIALLTYLGWPMLLFYLSVIGLLVSVYLAYLLYFKVKALCILCTSLYIINILLFLTIKHAMAMSPFQH